MHFLVIEKQFARSEAKEMLRSAIKTAALEQSVLNKYVAEASKDASFPVTIDLLNKTIFLSTLYLEPSFAKFTSEDDHRDSEGKNFADVAQIVVEEAGMDNWTPNVKGKSLSNAQLKARRIWHKGAALTWAPYLKSILYFALHTMTNDEREKLLYRGTLTEKELGIVRLCLKRLFGHPLWDAPGNEIDSLLGSSRKQDELFSRQGLTEKYVIYGQE